MLFRYKIHFLFVIILNYNINKIFCALTYANLKQTIININYYDLLVETTSKIIDEYFIYKTTTIVFLNSAENKINNPISNDTNNNNNQFNYETQSYVINKILSKLNNEISSQILDIKNIPFMRQASKFNIMLIDDMQSLR